MHLFINDITSLLTRDAFMHLLFPEHYWPEMVQFHLHNKWLATGMNFCKNPPVNNVSPVLGCVVVNGKLCLYLKCRKNILRFLDAERDVSVVKSSFKPGDVIHYVLDRRRTLNISQDLHSLLPEVSPMKNRRFKTCAVVGNSGILLDSECGKEIDSHNFVIRWVFFCC